jgi:hypothetical protein
MYSITPTPLNVSSGAFLRRALDHPQTLYESLREKSRDDRNRGLRAWNRILFRGYERRLRQRLDPCDASRVR